MNVYEEIDKFLKKYPETLCFRRKKHASIIEKHLNPDEKILYVFGGQKNREAYIFISSCVVALTNKRIMIGQKKLLWGYRFTTVTPDLYSDLKVRKALIWSSIEIDTIHENLFLSNIDPKAAVEIETVITDFMMEAKKKYAKNN